MKLKAERFLEDCNFAGISRKWLKKNAAVKSFPKTAENKNWIFWEGGGKELFFFNDKGIRVSNF